MYLIVVVIRTYQIVIKNNNNETNDVSKTYICSSYMGTVVKRVSMNRPVTVRLQPHI